MSRASIGDYVVTSKLGSGSFAVVYKGYHKTSKTPVAIKALSLSKLNGKLLENLEMEISIMRQIDHPNVVKLYDIKKTDKHMYLMLEYCAGGDLQQYVRRRQQESKDGSGKLLGEQVARHFLRELAKGMQCLWQHNLIHRDLKPQNLLLVEDSPTSALKIADFGFARHLATTSMAETLCGSPLYMAPEILRFQKYDAKADLWSVGTILFEMLAGRPPYGGANHVQLLANIERQPLRFPPTLQLSRPCRHLLVALLQRKPALRLGFAEFFADPFVDLQPLPEQAEEADAVRRSSTLSTTASIREEEEEDEQGLSGRWGVSTAGSSRTGTSADHDVETAVAAASPGPRRGSSSDRDRRSRAFSVSHGSSSRFASTAPSGMMRHSRSGNLEVMETAFASASSGSGALRRSSSSRLARSRRASSSGSGLTGAAASGASPKLSPQMSPHVLPSPSPRINPFKQLSESPPGAAALQQQQHSLSGSSRTKSPAAADAIVPKQKSATGHALDSSGEYVLVDGLPERQPAGAPRQDVSCAAAVDTPSDAEVTARSLRSGGHTMAAAPETFSREYGQQLIDIVVLRTQAIAPIADQLWALSAADDASLGSGTENTGPAGQDWSHPQSAAGNSSSTSGSKRASGVNLSSVFSMSSSLASSVGVSNALGDEDEADDDDDDDKRAAERQYVCAAEALALYVKCLRLVQHVVLYLRQDPAYSQPRGSSGSSSESAPGTSPGWSETSRKVSMAFLTEQLTHFLDRAEQCKTRMAHTSRLRTSSRPVASQEELLYAHALRIGRQGAIREVLGHTGAAHDHYLQALLLLESLLMDTSGASGTGAGALAVDDHKNVNNFLRALEQRLKNVRTLLEDEESADASASRRRRVQHPPRPHHQLTYHRSATAAAL